MNLSNHARTLVLSALVVAASVLGGSVVRVSAEDNNPFIHDTKASCQAAGYQWDDVKGCADQYCLDGLMGYGDPGEAQEFQGHTYMCDGFTGQWTEMGIRAWVYPTGPLRRVGPPLTAR